ncbi:glucans biosynthesis protein G [Alteromonas halophila]|uniref:Glucans biosynthesis protein G n=1 Tax=Alteromonas halophila TaxID=516698 RepID=A0A918N0P9_9ALTE|nr:glucans biosynthesis protein G [Alteromonas halophila]
MSALMATAIVLMSTQMGYAQSSSSPPSADSSLLQSIIKDAKQSAGQDYTLTDHKLHEKLAGMDYQQYRAIRFRPEQSLWKETSPYDVQLFHPGFLYDKPVTIYTVGDDNEVTRLPFSAEKFRYDKGAQQFAGLTNEKNGYAGFRLHYPINRDDYRDEFVVFLGASYFRLVGQDQVYGLSARGLALNTGSPEGEEFPHFTAFWLKQPDEEGPVTVYARLESESVTGAYRFVITPGQDTTVDVKSWLFAREDVEKLGIAPFTSMYLYGENSATRPDDYRPEVHDSDGVLMHTHAGERIWRPLTNPANLQITSLSDTAPQGFGMLQRDLNWQSYLDSEALYHQRPGLWVTPEAGFDKGRLELVEIPTDSETHDNIVAYWVPASPMQAGDERYFAYQLKTVNGAELDTSVAQVVRTRHGSTVLPGEEATDESAKRRFTVDFSAPDTAAALTDATLVAEAANASVSETRVFAVNGGKEWRATFLVTPKSDKPVDMRVHIASAGKRLSEVWNYVYQPK